MRIKKEKKKENKKIKHRVKVIPTELECPFCHSSNVVIPITGLIEIYQKGHQLRVATRKIEPALQPTLICNSCRRRFEVDVEKILDLQERINDALQLDFDSTRPSPNRNIVNKPPRKRAGLQGAAKIIPITSSRVVRTEVYGVPKDSTIARVIKRRIGKRKK